MNLEHTYEQLRPQILEYYQKCTRESFINHTYTLLLSIFPELPNYDRTQHEELNLLVRLLRRWRTGLPYEEEWKFLIILLG